MESKIWRLLKEKLEIERGSELQQQRRLNLKDK